MSVTQCYDGRCVLVLGVLHNVMMAEGVGDRSVTQCYDQSRRYPILEDARAIVLRHWLLFGRRSFGKSK